MFGWRRQHAAPCPGGPDAWIKPRREAASANGVSANSARESLNSLRLPVKPFSPELFLLKIDQTPHSFNLRKIRP
jgi:hypothetical protein